MLNNVMNVILPLKINEIHFQQLRKNHTVCIKVKFMKEPFVT